MGASIGCRGVSRANAVVERGKRGAAEMTRTLLGRAGLYALFGLKQRPNGYAPCE